MSAESLTAFGNTVPTSFLRLVPHQEAPTSICWGDRNRSVLVRVPLGWQGVGDRMLRNANPLEPADASAAWENTQTVELRSPDGSANVHLLLAGMAVAARHGLEHPDALKVADQLYVKADATKVEGLKQLPASCFESAQCLARDRARYEEGGVFPAGLIDSVIKEPQGLRRPQPEREDLRQRRLPEGAGEPAPALRLGCRSPQADRGPRPASARASPARREGGTRWCRKIRARSTVGAGNREATTATRDSSPALAASRNRMFAPMSAAPGQQRRGRAAPASEGLPGDQQGDGEGRREAARAATRGQARHAGRCGRGR